MWAFIAEFLNLVDISSLNFLNPTGTTRALKTTPPPTTATKTHTQQEQGEWPFEEVKLTAASLDVPYSYPGHVLDLILESFRFEDSRKRVRVRNLTKSFCACSQKKRHPRRLHFTFISPKKLVRLFILKGLKPSPDSRMMKFLTFDNLFPPQRHSR